MSGAVLASSDRRRFTKPDCAEEMAKAPPTVWKTGEDLLVFMDVVFGSFDFVLTEDGCSHRRHVSNPRICLRNGNAHLECHADGKAVEQLVA